MAADLDQLRRIETTLRAAAQSTRDVQSCGPFHVMIWPGSALPYVNYATPAGACADWDGAVADLRMAFQAHRRQPRVELFPGLWPEADAALARAGWRLEREAPVMVATAADLRPAPAPLDVEARALSPDDPDVLLDAFLRVQAAAFTFPPEDLGPTRVAELRRELAAGGTIVIALIEGARVRGGATVLGAPPIAELAGVGVEPGAQRRGLGAHACTVALQRFFAGGGRTAWLGAGDTGSESLYRRLGFRTIGIQRIYVGI